MGIQQIPLGVTATICLLLSSTYICLSFKICTGFLHSSTWCIELPILSSLCIFFISSFYLSLSLVTICCALALCAWQVYLSFISKKITFCPQYNPFSSLKYTKHINAMMLFVSANENINIFLL
jgi:hypothetical protein